MFIASWLLTKFGVRFHMHKHQDITRFEREWAANQAAGPARLPWWIRRRLDGIESEVD